MPDPVDGFYALYFTGREGYGAAMLVVMNGKLVGADPHGVRLDGTYTKAADFYSVKVGVTAPPGADLVQGSKTGPAGHFYEITFGFKQSFEEQQFIRVDTPLGPVNVTFKKLREMDV